MIFKSNDMYRLEECNIVLDNGLKINFIRKKGFKTKVCMLSVKCGSMNRHFINNNKEYIFPQGIAHAIEHKIYQMSDGSDAFLKLSDLGCEANALTDLDVTTYEFVTLRDIEEPLKITLDFVFNAKFYDDTLENEKKIIIREANLYKDKNDYLLYNAIRKRLYNNEIGEKIIGEIKDIKKLNASMLNLFYNAFYKPNNMVLTIVGDVSFSNVFNLITSFFKNKKYDLELPKTILKNPQTLSNPYLVKTLNKASNSVEMGFIYKPISQKEVILFDCLLYIYYQPSSKNIMNLINDGIIDYNIEYTFTYSDNYYFIRIKASCNDSFKAISSLKDNYMNLCESLINDDILDKYKKMIIGSNLTIANNIYDLCEEIHELKTINMDYKNKIEYAKSITLDDLKKAFKIFKNLKYSITYTK